MAIRLTGIEVADSPDDASLVRLSGDLTLEDRAPGQTLWIEVDRAHGDALTRSGDPWLMALLPLAAETGQALRIDAPVDQVLYERAHELMRIWHHYGWTPNPRVPVEVEEITNRDGVPQAERTGLFFTGGVDSTYSLLSNTPENYPERSYRIDDLVYIWGLDLALEQPEVYQRERVVRQAMADATGTTLLDVRTNLRATMRRGKSWGWVHPMVLVAVGLSLGERCRRLLVASDRDYTHQKLVGISTTVVPHWSSSQVQFIIDGGSISRFGKLEYLASLDVARTMLKVCTDPPTQTETDSATDDNPTPPLNCGKCAKCLRTMAALDLMGQLDAFTTFDRRFYPWALADVEPGPGGAHDFVMLSEMARAARRKDLARLLNGYARRHNRKYQTRRARLEATLSESVMPARLARRIGQALEWGYTRVSGGSKRSTP